MPAHRTPSIFQQTNQVLAEGLHQQKLTNMLYPQELQLEARFDRVVAQYHQAHVKFQQMKQECEQLRSKLAVQQLLMRTQHLATRRPAEATSRPLPTHPPAITPELQYCIEATWSAFWQLRQL